MVVRTEPDTFARLGGFSGPVRFHFDERISERASGGELSSAVVVSPRTGAVSVEHGRRDLSVRVEGGYRPGLTYRVTLLPVISDLFGNQLRNAFELVFSTGGETVPTAVAGVVWDRITGRGVEGIEVRAGSPTQPGPHLAVTGQGGIYALRYLPPGSYELTAFEDLNRDDSIGFVERHGSALLELEGADTILVDVAILQADTTAARLTDVSVLDSLTVVLEMDDFVHPSTPIEDFAVLVERMDGELGPPVERLFREHEYAAYVEEVRDSLARLDSLEAAARAAARPPVPDTAARADTVVVPDTVIVPDTLRDTLAVRDTAAVADTARARPQARPARRGPPALPGSAGGPGGGVPAERGPLPGQRLVVQLQRPLEPEVPYRVIVTGVVNLNELPEGGGLDTLRMAPDTSAARERRRGAGR